MNCGWILCDELTLVNAGCFYEEGDPADSCGLIVLNGDAIGWGEAGFVQYHQFTDQT